MSSPSTLVNNVCGVSSGANEQDEWGASFTQIFESHIVASWKQQYFNYTGVHNLISTLFPSLEHLSAAFPGVQSSSTSSTSTSTSSTSSTSSFRMQSPASPSSLRTALRLDRERTVRTLDRHLRSRADENSILLGGLTDVSESDYHDIAHNDSKGESLRERRIAAVVAHMQTVLAPYDGTSDVADHKRGVDDDRFATTQETASESDMELGKGELSEDAKREQIVVAVLTELTKVDAFFRIKEAQLSDRTKMAVQSANNAMHGPNNLIQSEMVHVFRQVTMLQNFAKLNITACHNIWEKFLHASNTFDPEKLIDRMVDHQYFTESERTAELAADLVHSFAIHFEHGDRDRAKVRLFAHLTESAYSATDTMRLHTKFGIVAVLALWSAVFLLDHLYNKSVHDAFFPVFRGVGLLIVQMWLWGISIYYWTKYRVNFVYIFEFNPRTRLTHQQIFEEAADLSIFFFISSLLYGHDLGLGASRVVFPLSLLVFTLLKLFAPLQYFSYWQSRKPLLNTLANIVIAPFGRVRFMDFFVADILTSMVKVMVDLVYDLCFLASGSWIISTNIDNSCTVSKASLVPFIVALPLWFRFMQCIHRYYYYRRRFPDLANALKYAISQAFVIMGSYHPIYTNAHETWSDLRDLWVFLGVTATLYAFLWDIFVDWGLGHTHTRHPGLRDQLMYPKALYYVAAVLDFFLRFAWTLTILPFTSTLVLLDHNRQDLILLPLLYFLELFRRFIWGLIRVENEHVNNTEQFRREQHVPIFFDNAREASMRKRHTGNNYGVLAEASLFVGVVIVVSVLVANA
jgi:xenotropic and polytropic retrovirus receptor 1